MDLMLEPLTFYNLMLKPLTSCDPHAQPLTSCDPCWSSSLPEMRGWDQARHGWSPEVFLTWCFCCGSDFGEAALKIVGVTTDDDGIYTCIAVNDMGSASSSASLRVLGKWGPQVKSSPPH